MNPKGAILEYLRSQDYKPGTKEDIALYLDISPDQWRDFFPLLDQLEKEHIIIKSKKGKYRVATDEELKFFGTIQGNASGSAFFISDVKGTDDIFISRDDLNSAMHKDRVQVELIHGRREEKRQEGRVVKILQRNSEEIIGTFDKRAKYGFVVPDDKKYGDDIYVPLEKSKDARQGDKVVSRVDVYPSKGKNPEGHIIEIIGNKDDKGVDISSIARQFRLPNIFSPETLRSASQVETTLKETDLKERMDYRELFTVTIDGEDAKDFDDAISIEKIDNKKYRLFVHIADVSHYVSEGSPLDKDAYARGNSVYLLDRVIPMLPKELSNGICSLNPNEDRLVLTVVMEIGETGQVKNYEFQEGVINSNYRLIYTDVSNYLEGKSHPYTDMELMENLKIMGELYEILHEKRDIRGSIDFNFHESEIILDAQGKAVDIVRAERRIANRLIEEFMLVTNETVGAHFGYMGVPFLYRIHEEPSPEKVQEFKKILHNFGYKIKGNDLHSKDFQQIIKNAEGKKEELLISTLLLRALQKAIYSRDPDIHFGLSTKYYSHFTSPIRRYPDLVIHRILKKHLHGTLKNIYSDGYLDKLDRIAEHTSITERRADEAEREVEDLKKAEYMEDKIGCEYEGVLSSLTSFGMFVELENTVEGLVAFKNMDDDYYRFDEEGYYVIGERSHRIYKIGEKVRVEVLRASSETRTIDFKLIEDME